MKKHTSFIIFVILVIFFNPFNISAAGTLDAAGASSDALAEEISLPVTSVNLYSSGLAQVVQTGRVSGDAVINLDVNPDDINDILKSLVAEDLGGGYVDVISFDSSEPLYAALQDLRINPSGADSLYSFLSKLQGEEVSLITGSGLFSGRIFSVEDGYEGGPDSAVLNLMTSSGLKPVSLSGLRRISFADDSLQQELESALELISGSRVRTRRNVGLSFRGTGDRDVRISYIRKVPLWKTSYRLRLDEKGSTLLEGWAIVQNTGTSDWKDIKLTFTAGSPNAFIMDLATPVYVDRQTISNRPDAPVAAVEYDRAYGSSATAKSYAEAPMRSMAADNLYDYVEEEAYLPAPAPAAVQASGERSGNFYRYEVSKPVTVKAGTSAMVPVIVDTDAGFPVGVYDPAYDLVFKGVMLENDTRAHWSYGPATVLEGRAYAGDTIVPDIIPDADQLVTYAVHGTSEVVKSEGSISQRISAMKIVDGILYRSDIRRKNTEYRINGNEEKLIIIHPKAYGWKMVEGPEVFEENSGEYRFIVGTDHDKVIVTEEYPVSYQYGLENSGLNDIALWIEWKEISASMKSALQRIAELKKDIERIRSEASLNSSSLSRLERDQNRVRENMKVLDKDSDLYIRYSGQLEKQETDIQQLNTRAEALAEELLQAQNRLKDYIASLKL